ncbi:unnamed protein product [Rhizophagus irregularis]|nr:unnamed protein product [Rhizophagus irregularis]
MKKNIILSTFLKRIKSILNLPDFPKDSLDFFYTIQLQSRSEIYYFIKTSNRTMHQKLKNRIGVLASESDSPVRVGIISCNRRWWISCYCGTLISTACCEQDYQFLGLLQNLQNRLNDPLSYQ